MQRHKHTYAVQGWVMTEILVGLVILGILMSVAASLVIQSKTVQKRYLQRQQCISAAEAQLDSIQYESKQITNDEIQKNWPGVELIINSSSAKKKWKGFTLYEVTGKYETTSGTQSVVLARYIPTKESEK